MRGKHHSGILAASLTLLVAAAASPIGAAAQEDDPQPIAQKYPIDKGIADDPRVIFADDFDGWEPNTNKPPAGTWTSARPSGNRDQLQNLAVPGRVEIEGKEQPGGNVLLLRCWNGSRSSAGVTKHLGNYNNRNEGLGDGYEEVYIRWYQKLDPTYVPERNHGANLGGRDLSRPGSWYVGRADTMDVAANGYFYSGLQPYDERRTGRLYWGFYSYHVDKKQRWGENYEPTAAERKTIEPGRWYCVERHMKLNSVDPADPEKAAFDGIEELWIDGERVISRTKLRFRKVPTLKINVFGLEVYYHGLPAKYTADKPVNVYYDNLVIAKERIGCLSPAVP
ncbi:MAG: hypothetical protein WD066_19250 [Planctomycetaceae bacterium]